MPLDFSEIILSIEGRVHDTLAAMKEQDVSSSPAPGKWSKKATS